MQAGRRKRGIVFPSNVQSQVVKRNASGAFLVTSSCFGRRDWKVNKSVTSFLGVGDFRSVADDDGGRKKSSSDSRVSKTGRLNF